MGTKQLWPPWSEVFQPEQVDCLSQFLHNKAGVISFQNYQQLAGDVGKGGLDNKISFMLMIAKVSKENLSTDSLKKCIIVVSKAFSKTSKQEHKISEEDSSKLASSLVHDLVFQNEKRKSSFLKEETNVEIDMDDIEKVLLSNPLVENMISEIMNYCFKVNLKSQNLLPKFSLEIKTSLTIHQII